MLMAPNLPESGRGWMADRKSCCLVPSPESQVCHVASASKKVSRGQGQKRDGRRKCSDLQGTVKPGLLYVWTLYQADQEAVHAICVVQGQGSFAGRPVASPFQPWEAPSLSSFFQQAASCNPVASLRSKPHLSPFPSQSAEPISPP